jgi:uncharacterized protein (TIGR03437 family)
MRFPCLLALLYANAFAQGFGQLATNRDGSVLYFSSPLRIKGTDQYLHPKIFSWDNVNGIRLYEQRTPDVPFPTPAIPGAPGAHYFSLVAPDVTGDDATVAVTGIRLCAFSDSCLVALEEYQSSIYAAGRPSIDVPGTASLSRNGRYALLRSSVFSPFGNSKMSLLDLQTGQQTAYTGEWEPPGGKHQVANDGTVALVSPGGFSIGQSGQLKAVPAPVALTNSSPIPLFHNPLINAAGSLVIYQAGGGTLGPARLSAYSVTTGSSIDLVTETADAPDFRPSISDDGSLVAFVARSNRQVYVVGGNGSGLRQISSFPETIIEVALSGDGLVALAVTATNRIVRINVAAAQSVDIVPPTPYTNVPAGTGLDNSFVQSYRIRVSRGAVTTITGLGFAVASQDAEPPYPLSLGGVELRVGGTPIPIAGVSPNSISYPATWDLPDTPVDLEVWVSSTSASPFVPGVEVEPMGPSFYTVMPPSGPATLVAAHQDFQSFVSTASPAQPGEYIHIYARNLGPVLPAPFAGLRAPLQPLSELAVPISCTLSDTNPVPVEVTFAGLAPGLLNVFQIDVHLPPTFQGRPSGLTCEIGYPSLGYFIGGVFGP